MDKLHIGIISAAAILSITTIAFYYEYKRFTKQSDNESKKSN